ncbi:Phosphate transport ATP-binding protein PstB [Streptococcus sp. HSISB1]|nr:Phosphate transport ATP-binding protein PstB [Streptococcus sp. HSISB1]
MTKYNWNERQIITFPEEKLALSTKDLHVYYGQKEAIKGIDMQFEKIKSLRLSVHQDVVNQLFFAA